MAAETGSRIYVHNLPWDLSNEELAIHMGTAGTVTYANIMSFPDGRSKGCAIVHYSAPEEAAEAIRTLSESELKGRKILVREDREGADGPKPRAGAPVRGRGRGRGRGGAGGAVHAAPARTGAPRPAPVPGTSLHIGNLAWGVTWRNLKDAFAEYNVTYADVRLKHDGTSMGWGIVRFETPEDAAAAMTNLQGLDLMGRPISIREDRGPRVAAASE